MIQNRDIVCTACKDSDAKKEYTVKENMFGLHHEFVYLECMSCGSLQIKYIPENLSFYYSSEYYTSTELILSSPLKNIYKKIRWQIHKRNLLFFHSTEYLHWLKPLNLRLDHKIADIGCGNGQLLYEMHCSGFNNLYGFDPFLHKEILFDGLKISKCNVADIEGQFDVIMLHHSFEHMADPTATMKKLTALLKPGGKLLIRVPVSDAEVWKTEGINWFQLDAPRHLYIPSVKAMKIMGDSNGLILEQIIFDSNEKQFVITDMYKKNIPLKENNPFDFVDNKSRKSSIQKAKQLNKDQKGDQACFYFTKA